MLPSPTELTYFIEIVKYSNFTRASQSLGVSQPLLSQTIKKLEDSLGKAIFIRHKKGVTLTSAGEQLLIQVKPLLDHWDKTKELASQAHDEVRGRVTIGCRSTVIAEMHDFVRFLLLKHPCIEMHFNCQNSLMTTDAVINSTIDIGMAANPIQHPDLVMHKISERKVGFWVGSGESEIQDIHSGKVVMICEPNQPQSQKLIREIGERGIKISRVMTVNSLEAVAQFTITGCGVGILPSCFATFLGGEKLKLLEDAPSIPIQTYIIYRKENRDVKVIKTILSALKEFAKTRLQIV